MIQQLYSEVLLADQLWNSNTKFLGISLSASSQVDVISDQQT